MIVLRSVKGSNLVASEVDGNFEDLDDRLQALEAAPTAGVPPSNMTVSGTQWTIYYPDGLTFGPFTLPQAMFRPSVVKEIDADTSGVYDTVLADLNGYLRYSGSAPLVAMLKGDDEVAYAVDSEITFRQVGDGTISFDAVTGVLIIGMAGFLNRTGGMGSTVTAKKVASNTWELIGRLAEDVTG
ncbi:MAG: hypothetical protein EOQ52_20360 [Mesorhizobium sp.]|uniref:hypothetical protein n=1 Tax=Mesorhizobium sp. TaxID=1871066 RepID=UPI000FE767BA|nr:hypothetical protein [Mesorhizobium sp.]RWB85907.1 MAG: hypothetical protein EOQ52_20360 [Mesorhizobium sp.]